MGIWTAARRLLPVLALLIVAAPARLDACSCVADIPLCESFWSADAVFEGEVTGVERLPVSKGVLDLFAQRRVQLRVTRTWRGEVEGSVTVMTGSGGGDCGYSFRTGRKYLVYAAEHEGKLTTSICSPTKPLDRAARDLDYLSRAETAAGGRIYGTVRAAQGPPASRYTVVLRGAPDGQRQAVTNRAGEFEFTAVPPGEYSIRVVVHPGERAYGREDITLRDPRACARRDFTTEPAR